VQIALAVSITIELIQYLSRAWGSDRSADVNDVILNVLGASLGLLLMTLPRLRRSARPADPRDRSTPSGPAGEMATTSAVRTD
jgi:glycopeptide antibiotics resistance protein